MQTEHSMQLILTSSTFKEKFKTLSDKSGININELESTFIKRWINSSDDNISQIKVTILDNIV